MGKQIFSGAAWIHIQGEEVLHFRRIRGKHAEYSVIGLGDPVIVYDYRKSGMEAIKKTIQTEQVSDFPAQFNAPAEVNIREYRGSRTIVKLKDTTDVDPAYRLWIAVGVKRSIPLYNYLFTHLFPLPDQHLALFALYSRPSEE